MAVAMRHNVQRRRSNREGGTHGEETLSLSCVLRLGIRMNWVGGLANGWWLQV